MKLLFTGGGSGGHFYPIIAVVQEIQKIAREDRLVKPKLYYISSSSYDARVLYENDIQFRRVMSGKLRRYFSLLNIFDAVKVFLGIIQALWKLYTIYPDVVFSKGGYESFPTVLAARLLRIPVLIHESDAIPGRVNLWTAKFAVRIAISYPEAAQYFPKKKVAHLGNPVRRELQQPARAGAHEFLKLNRDIPTLLILGGSQGAQKINNAILEALPELIERYQIIHQVGKKNLKEIKITAEVVLEKSQNQNRYKVFGYLNSLAMRMAAGAADLVVSRAGSGAIFEIAAWGKPSVIIPIPESISRDQRKNAFAYARAGATHVIEEVNLSPHVLVAEIHKIMDNSELRAEMAKNAKKFSRPEAANKIARALIDIALKHEYT